MQIASADLLKKPGFLVDYSILSSTTNFVAEAGKTYYVSGTVNLSGTNNIFESAVLKFATNATIAINPTGISGVPALTFSTSSAFPLICTAKDDDSVGDQIAGSTHSPTNY